MSEPSSPTAHPIEQNGTGRPQMSAPQVSHRELGGTQTSQVGSPQGGSLVDGFEADDSFSIPFMGCTLTGWTDTVTGRRQDPCPWVADTSLTEDPLRPLPIALALATLVLPLPALGICVCRCVDGEMVSPSGQFPYARLASEVDGLIQALYDNGWVEPFDWSEFQDEAIGYFENPSRLETAGLETIRKVLTLHVRKDRFCDGHFLEMLEARQIQAILRRLETLQG